MKRFTISRLAVQQVIGILLVMASIVTWHELGPLLALPGLALAMYPVNLGVSQLWRAANAMDGFELQHQDLYSLVTLPAAINPAGGINFFGDTIATVGLQRTNLDRPQQVPAGTDYEIHGIKLAFLAPITVVYSSFVTAMRDAFLELFVNQSKRFTQHLRGFTPATIVAPSFSAAAADNPVVTDRGYDGWIPFALPILISDSTNFQVRITFITDVAALGSTVVGVFLGGLINRGNVKLDSTPFRSWAQSKIA